MTRVVRVVWLTAIWVLLWSDLSVANLASGLLLAVVVVAWFDRRRSGNVIIRPIAAAKFASYFLYQLISSTLVVARTVITPQDRINTAIVAVPLSGCSDALVTLIADAISLTPGTLTLEVRREPLTLYVHALDVRDIDGLRHVVRTLEVLAVTAFGDDDALEGLVVDDTSVWRGR